MVGLIQELETESFFVEYDNKEIMKMAKALSKALGLIITKQSPICFFHDDEQDYTLRLSTKGAYKN